MKLAQCVLSLLVIGQSMPAFADTLTDLLPSETKVVFGIRVHNIAFSPLVKSLASQANGMTGDWMKLIPSIGFDPLRDIDEVLIATAGEGKTAPTLLIAAGRFDVAKLGEHARLYRNVPMLGGEKEGDGVIALLSPELALAGDQAMVRAAIDHRDGGTKIDRALNDRITSLRQRYDVWGLGDHPGAFAQQLGDAKGLESVDRFQFGMQLTSGLELSGEVHVASAEEAEKLNQSLQLMAMMLKSQQTSDGAKFDLQVDGGTLKFAVSIPDAELKKMMQPEAAEPKTAAEPATSTVPATSPELGLSAKPAPSEVSGLAPAPTPVVEPAKVDPVKIEAKPAAKVTPRTIFDKEGNTVVVTLPGKK